MTRSQCDMLSGNVLRIYQDMEDEILRMIAAQIGRDGNVSDTSKWRIRQLARSGQMNARTAGIISSYLPAQAEAVYDAVISAAADEIGRLDSAVQAANTAGLAEYFSDVPAEDSALFAARAFQEQAATDLNMVNTVMQYKAGSTYVDAINGIYYDTTMRQDRLDDMGVGAAMLNSGHVSLQEATRKTIHRMAQKGIPAFVDKLGREWSPEAYVMMDMRSTLGNTARAAQNMRCDQYGIQLIAVSSHMGARPKCAPYQGRIFSRNDTSGVTEDGNGNRVEYSPLSSTSFGEPDGLFGINCGHLQYPFIPGVNVQRYFPYDEEQNAERYKQFQRQRAMERDIRATKRECMMLQAAGDDEGLQKASQRLRRQKEKYSQFCTDTGLGSHLDRTQVYGYDRSKSSKTVWAERKAKNMVTSINHTQMQYYNRLSDEIKTSAKRFDTEINLTAIEHTHSSIYVSDKSDVIKPKQLHEMDMAIEKAKKALHISENDAFPDILIVTHEEMGKDVPGAYNPIKNQLYLVDTLFVDAESLQQQFACPDNQISTIVHELIHWMDATDYKIKNGDFLGEDDYKKYMSILNSKAKKELDKAAQKGYNICEISKYANKSFNDGNYIEAYTEYRTFITLKE